MKLRFKRLSDAARMPAYAHQGDSGMDVFAVRDTSIPANGYEKVGTGLAADIPDGYEIQVRPRSGLFTKSGVVCAFGTVDGGYRGEIGVVLYNHTEWPYQVRVGDKVAQFVLAPVVRAEVEETAELSSTERGAGGFGSTGK